MKKPNLSPEMLETAKRQAALCRIFGNPQRILILWLLAEQERTVTEIALAIGASLQSASQHLRLMGFSHFVESRRERHNIYYHLSDNSSLEACLVLAHRPKTSFRKSDALTELGTQGELHDPHP